MMDQEELGREVFAAVSYGFATGDFAALAEYLADDVELTFFGSSPGAGTFGGKDAVLRWFSGTQRFFPKGFQFDVHNIMSSERAVAVEWTDRATTRDGQAYENRGVTVLELRGGQVSAYREYLDTERVKALF